MEPVVSKKSGLLFERSLIEKYIQEEGKCPVTQQELSHEDLIVLKGNNTTTQNRIISCNRIFYL